ncbi:SDR family oxidoreductase [Spirosoma radiotolerans]|uniref:NmrA family transcriptional regulator n=1 Tax=Spirosoma radiotolerans TaxID=1379870 RepID=A0A0E3V785_9BACT|nr:SDR family oxidoreductase [Spirosoma radiotolerans]AKD55191.1 NmrA family transcriptional regulator [Spirosoma radiotolerans]
MILVTGATGHLGNAVIHQLLQKLPASQIVAFVRDKNKGINLLEQGVTVRVGTYDDTDALDNAMQGVETVLLIAGTDEENRVRQHQNVVDAAKKAHVQRMAYTSRALKDRATLVNQLMDGHFQTEDYIKESGLPYTLFQNSLYLDAIPQFVGGDAVFARGIYVPAEQGRVALALRSEMGEAIANALTNEHEGNLIYRLTGSESYSFYDVAAALTDLSGKSVTYTPADPVTFETQLIGRGLSDVVARRIVGFITDIANGQEDAISPDLEKLLGRKPTALKDGFSVLYNV